MQPTHSIKVWASGAGTASSPSVFRLEYDAYAEEKGKATESRI